MMTFEQAKAAYAQVAEGDSAALSACHRHWAVQCRELAISQGGVYIKAAQFVASLQGGAGDALPSEYVDEFKPMTDKVPPRPLDKVSASVESELGAPLVSLFAHVDEWPVAAASLAQVHRATTHDGRKVALKLQYPGLPEQVAADLMVMKSMSSYVKPAGKDIGWLLDDIERFVTSELDFRTEARHAMRAADAIKHMMPSAIIPSVDTQLSGVKVMSTAFIDGLIRLDDTAALKNAGLDPNVLGSIAAEAFATLSLVYGLVHGDPHCGNVYGRLCDGSSQLVILDHGLYHHLSDHDRISLCRLILACATPWPRHNQVNNIAQKFAGKLSRLLPCLISPSFGMATGLSLKELKAAAEGKLPEGTSLDDVWNTLVQMHGNDGNGNGNNTATTATTAADGGGDGGGGGGGDGSSGSPSSMLGLLHSFGYVRGLHNALNYHEEGRVRALAMAARKAVYLHESKSGGGGGGGGVADDDAGLARALKQTSRLVTLQFMLLRLIVLVIHIVTMVLACIPLGRGTPKAKAKGEGEGEGEGESPDKDKKDK